MIMKDQIDLEEEDQNAFDSWVTNTLLDDLTLTLYAESHLVGGRQHNGLLLAGLLDVQAERLGAGDGAVLGAVQAAQVARLRAHDRHAGRAQRLADEGGVALGALPDEGRGGVGSHCVRRGMSGAGR